MCFTGGGVIGVSGDGRVVLSWEASQDASHYTVKRRDSANSGDYTTIATELTETTRTDAGLTNGTRYFYAVAAVDGSGASEDSQQARGVPLRRPAPGVAHWPLSGSNTEDGDVIRYAFGPRDISRYDFHGGVDINAARGTPVHAVMAGTVTLADELRPAVPGRRRSR